MHIKTVSQRDLIYLPTVSIFPLPWVPKLYPLFPRERQKSSPKVVFLWTPYQRSRKPSITNPWHPGLYSTEGLVVLYSLKLSSKYYFNVTEECPFSLADMLKSYYLKQVLFTVLIIVSGALFFSLSFLRIYENFQLLFSFPAPLLLWF